MVGPWRTLRGQMPTVANYTDLRATEGRAGAVVYLLGRDTAGDGGEGLFRWNQDSEAGDDDGLYLASVHGRWEREVVDWVHAAWFGCKGDAVTDDTDAIQGAFNAAVTLGRPWVLLPSGECKVTRTIEIGARDDVQTDTTPGAWLMGTRSLVYHKTVLRWAGESGGIICRVRNASGARLEGVGFDGRGVAAYGLQVTHVLGDTDICTNVHVVDGYAVDATVANVLVGEASGTSYGDCSGLTFENFYVHGSSGSNHTASGILVTAQYTFGIVLSGCRLSSSEAGYPSANIRMYGGSLIMSGGLLDLAGDAAVVLEGHPSDPLAVFGSVTLDTVECQTGNKLLRTDLAGWSGGLAASLRAVCLRNCLHSDIIGAVSATSIYWDVNKFAVLVIEGCQLVGDVEVAAADAKVHAQGAFFAEGKGFTGTGLGRVAGSWLVASGITGVWQHRFPNLATYADNAAAVSGGLTTGSLYRLSTGHVMAVL